MLMWAIVSVLVLGVILTLLGYTGTVGGTWTFIFLAGLIVMLGLMLVLASKRRRSSPRA